MPFKKILVAVDGSEYSQVAAEYGLWLSSKIDADLAGQYIVDPRLVELFIDPVFVEELGLDKCEETYEKVFGALRKVGKTILDLFCNAATERELPTDSFLDEGYIVDEICRRAKSYDLVVLGHAGRGHRKLPQEKMVGSVAERVAVCADKPVLIAVQPVEKLQEVVVAFDGSEPARGALLMAEELAKNCGLRLRAMCVVSSSQKEATGKALVEQGESLLREYWTDDVFMIREGVPAETLMNYAYHSNSLLVLGAYGFRDPEENVMGSTTTQVVRKTQSSILVYR